MSYISCAMKVRRSTVLEIKAKGRSTLYAKKLLLRALRVSQEQLYLPCFLILCSGNQNLIFNSFSCDMAERSGCHLRRESAEGGGDFLRGVGRCCWNRGSNFSTRWGRRSNTPFSAVSKVAPNGAVKIVRKSRSKTAF